MEYRDPAADLFTALTLAMFLLASLFIVRAGRTEVMTDDGPPPARLAHDGPR